VAKLGWRPATKGNEVQSEATSKKTFYDKWAWLILLTGLAFVPFAYYGAGRAVQSNVNKVEDWLPKSYTETHELNWFRQNFPSDQFILVSWEGCKLGEDPSKPELDDPRIAKLCSLLTPNEDASDPDALEARRYFKGVQSGRLLLEQLTTGQHALAPEEAVERLKGALIGPDGRQTCVIVSLDPATSGKLKPILGHGQYRVFRPNVPPGILRRLIDKAGIPEADLRLGGPPVDNIAIDEEGERTLVRLAGLSGLLGLFLAWWSLRSLLLTWIVVLCSATSAAAALAVIWATGETVDAIVLSMPSLVYVLAISGAVHFINYYKDAAQHGLNGATERAVAHAIKPAILCSVTTAIGLLSLWFSELVPIQKFGLYSATGVMILNVVLFLILPSTLHLLRFAKRWEVEADPSKPSASTKVASQSTEPETFTLSERIWGAFSGYIVKHHVAVSIASLVLCIGMGIGLTRTRTSIDLLELFDSKARILTDYQWLEKNLGMLVPLEIVLEFDRESLAKTDESNSEPRLEDLGRLTFLERMETTQRIQEVIAQRFGEKGLGWVGRSMSAATFAPSMPGKGASTWKFNERRIYNNTLNSKRADFERSGFLRTDTSNGNELWRISLRVAAFQGIDYGTFVHDLSEAVNPVIEAHGDRVQILRRLASWTGDVKFAGKKVVLWDPVISGEGAEEAQAYGKIRADEISTLLTNARIKVSRATADTKLMPRTQIESLNDVCDAVVMVGAFSNSDAPLLGSSLSNVIDLHPDAKNKDSLMPDHWLTSVYTGVVPIVYKAQRALLQSLMESTLWSFLMITPLMIFVSRSFRAGLVAMIPNVLPVIFIFGLMGWLGIAIDIGSMMTASIALGVAVDDTIHFLSWFRGNVLTMRNRKAAIIASYRQCGTPTLQAACISGLGLSVFAFSTFTPTQRFGWLMLTILIAGVIAELVMLPAILAGPLGSVFEPRARKHRFLSRFFLLFRHEVRRRFDRGHKAPSVSTSETEFQSAA
jgi:predicted RND superfamily exporter protein